MTEADPPIAPPEATAAPRRSWLVRSIRAISIDQWRAIDAETQWAPRRGFDWTVLVILAVACLSLTLQEYWGDRSTFARWFTRDRADQYWELKSFVWWTGWRVFGYLLLPMLVVALLPGHRLRDYYVSLRGFFRHLPIYLLLFALIFVPVIIASRTAEFRDTYPFYRLANRSTFDLVTWELMYAAQFLSLEFFFRGFLLEGLRRHFGSGAIFVMIVPYCMIHYGKPMTETLGAIGAGVILGTLAMRTRSIWGGVLIHVAVAVTMDVMALQACPAWPRHCS
ncbi:MAG: CPBP family intramembrane metalloprotease [Kofleriaceae bacterium]|nr:CPBP family intramembrane metalloprotease [Kofleriaceae bacterium]MBP6841937.1 CPBP family intramembrane metalloprotease [Kofleriaceae bacterium]